MRAQFSKSAMYTLAFIGLIFSKCSLLDQDIDGNLSTYLSFSENKNETDIPYSSVEYLDASSDSDIEDNLDKIKDWSVTEISYKVWGFNGDPTTAISGTLGFSKTTEGSPTVTATFTNVVLSSISDNDTSYKVNLSESDLNTLAGYFEQDQAIKIYVNGVLSQGPAFFDLEVFAKVKVKAKL
jgi:hypothetical protein